MVTWQTLDIQGSEEVSDHSAQSGGYQRALDFFIIGSPRSGTTLAQRLLLENAGVAIPRETHFFSVFAPERNWDLPMPNTQLRDHLMSYADLEISPITRADVEPIMHVLDGSVIDLFDVFCAIVRHLAPDSPLVGEKTPHHLLWWRPLARAFPLSKFVWVVRDPRDVVESNLRMPWGMNSAAALAEMWRLDQRQLDSAEEQLEGRLTVVKYEELVEKTEELRAEMATHIGLDPFAATRSVTGSDLSSALEYWKLDVVGPVRSDRIGRWRSHLDQSDIAIIEAICHREMLGFGYESTNDSGFKLAISDRFRSARVRHSRSQRARAIERLSQQHLGPAGPPAEPSAARPR